MNDVTLPRGPGPRVDLVYGVRQPALVALGTVAAVLTGIAYRRAAVQNYSPAVHVAVTGVVAVLPVVRIGGYLQR